MRDRAASCSTRRRRWPARWPRPGAPTGHDGFSFPRLHLPFDRLLAATTTPVWHAAPRSPKARTRPWWRPRLGPGGGRRRAAGQAHQRTWPARATGSSSAPRAGGPPTAWPRSFAEAGLVVGDATGRGRGRRPRPARGAPHVAPLERGFVLPALKLAVLAEADVTGRRRAHRRARPRARATEGFFDDLKPGDYVVHHQHGVARYGGMVKRAIGGVGARLPAARVPRRRQALRPLGPDRRRAPLHRRRVAGAQPPGRQRLAARPRRGCARRCARSPRSWSCSTRRRVTTPGHAFGPDTPWQHELEDSLPLHRDPRPAQGHRRGQGGHGVGACRWTGWSAATSASARPRSPCGRCSRRSRTASRRRSWCPPRCWPSSTSRPSPSASPATRCGSRCFAASSPARRPAQVVDGLADGSGRRRHRHPPAARGRRRASRTSACSWSTRSSASG